jgi:hypothetical protein
MIGSDIFHTTSTEHHGEHHGNTAPDVHTEDTDSHISDSVHGDDEGGHHEEESEPKERKVGMKNKTASTITTIALSAMFIVVLAASTNASAATIRAIGITPTINGTITIDKIDEIDGNDININITKENITKNIVAIDNLNAIGIRQNSPIQTAKQIELIGGVCIITRIGEIVQIEDIGINDIIRDTIAV